MDRILTTREGICIEPSSNLEGSLVLGSEMPCLAWSLPSTPTAGIFQDYSEP